MNLRFEFKNRNRKDNYNNSSQKPRYRISIIVYEIRKKIWYKKRPGQPNTVYVRYC